MQSHPLTLVARKPGANVKHSLETLIQFLTDQQQPFQVDILTMSQHQINQVQPVDFETVEQGLVICLGGDGSLLKLVDHAAKYQLPVLGINMGKLGFLADLSIQTPEKLLAILQGQYKTCSRQLLLASWQDGKETKTIGPILNEVVIHRANLNKTLPYHLAVDDLTIASHHADGVIIATPTGSSAYALSAGGPLLAPELDCHVIVPICPHKLTSRPLCLPAERQIAIHLTSNTKRPAMICGDGHLSHDLPANAVITITRAAQPLQLIHPLEYNFFATLKNKLHWEKTPHAEDPDLT